MTWIKEKKNVSLKLKLHFLIYALIFCFDQNVFFLSEAFLSNKNLSWSEKDFNKKKFMTS